MVSVCATVEQGPLCQTLTRLVKVLTWAVVSSEARLGKNPLPSSHGSWRHSVPWHLLAEGSSSGCQLEATLSSCQQRLSSVTTCFSKRSPSSQGWHYSFTWRTDVHAVTFIPPCLQRLRGSVRVVHHGVFVFLFNLTAINWTEIRQFIWKSMPLPSGPQ